MPLLATKYHGPLEYDPADLFRFPLGLPGFELETSFLPLSLPGLSPLILLQSASTPDLVFPAIPILVADPNYELSVSFEDLATLGIDTTRQPVIGSEVLVLALLCVRERKPATANLMAPVVVDLQSRRAVQAVRCDFRYSNEYAMVPALEESAC